MPSAPRTDRRAALLGLALASGALAACTDATAPDPAGQRGPWRLVLEHDLPSGDTVPRLGVALLFARADTSHFAVARIWVDSASDPQAVDSIIYHPFNGTSRRIYPRAERVLRLREPGRHTITVAVEDSAGGRRSVASFTRTFLAEDAPYTVTALPDLGYGGGALGVAADGAVAGWAAGADGRPRAAVWRADALTLPWPTDSAPLVAAATNAAGDVLLQAPLSAPTPALRCARVLRADGTLLQVGTATIGASLTAPCPDLRYRRAGTLTEGRRAIATHYDAFSGHPSVAVVVDVAGARVLDSLPALATALNDRGQAAGYVRVPTGNTSSGVLRTFGFTPPALPPGPTPSICDEYGGGRWTSFLPIDVNDDASLLGGWCAHLVLLSATHGSTWLDRPLGAVTQARLAPSGGLVAALDAQGRVLTWRPGGTPRRAVLAAGTWRIDSIGGVNAAGVIAASGTDAATGRRSALRLVPGAR